MSDPSSGNPGLQWVAALRNPACFPHAAGAIEIVETHISWVVLAGAFAYKIKKPVNLGFLDFSTLDLRHAACADELRLNRRLAPDLYVDLARITGSPGSPRVDGPGPCFEYAVRMKRFDRTRELDRLLAAGTLTSDHVDRLARRVARFHGEIPRAADAQPWGTSAAVLATAQANFAHVRSLAQDASTAARVDALERWTATTHRTLAPALDARRRDGFVRECHGDLHLANIVLHDDDVVVFDCIEFNPALRWIDVMAEIAFTVMDFHFRGRPDLAQGFLNAYLEETGDYAGLAVLRFFTVYRALVRAKVAGIRAAQEGNADARDRDRRDGLAHLALAERLARAPRPALVVTFGPSGSGKSHAAAQLAVHGEWIRVRSDVERKRLAGLSVTARSGAGPSAGLYAGSMSDRTYARLAELVRVVIAAGYPVIVDATFGERARRDAMRALAAELRVPFVILFPQTPDAVMRARVAARAAAGTDPSEATVDVLEHQLASLRPPGDDERPALVAFDASGTVDGAMLARAVAARVNRG